MKVITKKQSLNKMTIKFTNAAKYYNAFPHQDEAWDWLQTKVSPEILNIFAAKYREKNTEIVKNIKSIEQIKNKKYTNTWEGILKAAIDAGAEYPEVVAAQWALESGNGKHVSGENNYFGLKGQGSEVNTKEFLNEKWIEIKDKFIDFPDLYSAVNYLVTKWYKDYKTWKGINNCKTWEAACYQLQKEGYATDPLYGEKLIEIIKSKNKIKKPKHSNPLNVEYMSQRDNYRDATRTCFSSSCAMMLKYLKPDSIVSDDDYIRKVFYNGDSTESTAQIKALFNYGLQARFFNRANVNTIKTQIDNNKPVPVGFLHKGTVQSPSGGGHWACVIGYDDDGFIVHDPWGELDLITGEYINTTGINLHYSYKNFNPRWMVEGVSTGWCILA